MRNLTLKKIRLAQAVVDKNSTFPDEAWFCCGQPQADLGAGGIDLNLAAGNKVQLIPDGLRNDEPACPINGNGMGKWFL